MKTSELQGASLDWAVAKALGILALKGNHVRVAGKIYPRPAYSTDWSQGGPLIEREKIEVTYQSDVAWQAGIYPTIDDLYCGPTPLIAAMRCYVASKLGDTIDIPEELQ